MVEAFVVYLRYQLLLGLIGVFRQLCIMLRQMTEKREVEVHHRFATAEIFLERSKQGIDPFARSTAHRLALQALHDMPVAVAPAVDRLLDIAYDEQGIAFTRQHIQ